MKKALIFVAILTLLLVGCTPKDTKAEGTPLPSTPAATETTTRSTASSTTTGGTSETEDPTPVGPFTFPVYFPSEDLQSLDTQEVTIDVLQPEPIIAALIEYGALKEGVEANSVVIEGNQLYLDMNEAFLMQVYTMGSTGEILLMGSLVNTFLSAYGCESLMLTVDGQIIYSGHVDYDFPLYFYTI